MRQQRRHRRVSTTRLRFEPFGGRNAYRTSYTRYANHRRIYSVPFGAYWIDLEERAA
ncbi:MULTISPECIES: hypothetical protein [unclassified Microbacterium]|uniref:hypothetical protein n=1 Tax=unclassified Microbacterium TaxID=2609290 RepID=UPI0016024226|nr:MULTISPECIES: hypothetical protein [unclassified Microbacterium]MBT2484793.1 hypothetical protein [Microbacterium sp. ISL-108]